MPMSKSATSQEPEQQWPGDTPSSLQTQTPGGDIAPEGTALAAINQVFRITSLLYLYEAPVLVTTLYEKCRVFFPTILLDKSHNDKNVGNSADKM